MIFNNQRMVAFSLVTIYLLFSTQENIAEPRESNVFSGGLPSVATDSIEVGRPNIVIIFADDLGYGDIGSFGS